MLKQNKQAPIFSGFGETTTTKEVIENINLKGTIAIVTGGHAGMGLEITKSLTSAGATVLVPARNIEKAHDALKDVPNVEIGKMDLMSPTSIDTFAEEFLKSGRPLHLLINNAGLMTVPENRDARGNISQFSTNNLGHFQLTARLWPALKKAQGARIVSVSSRAHRIGGFHFDDPNYEKRAYDKELAYAESKTGNILFTVEVDKLGRAQGIRAFAVHPGMVPHSRFGKEDGLIRKITTNIFVKMAGLFVRKIKDKNGKPIPDTEKPFFKTVSQGAATAVWCATSPQLKDIGGIYCEDCDIAEAVTADSLKAKGVRPWAIDPVQASQFWNVCEKYTSIKFEN